MVNDKKFLYSFQEDAITKLIDFLCDENSKQTIVMKAPTGAGKTIILIDFIEQFFDIEPNTAFIWLCPGKGDLEEQSRKKMNERSPWRDTQDLPNALLQGFSAGKVTFINWELVTKKGNTAVSEREKANLFGRIAEAHRSRLNFVVIIDEEHSNDTAKAKDIIDAFSAKHIIRVSATAKKNEKFEYFEIDELDVINAELITKAIYVNEGIAGGINIDADYDYLLDLADRKRREIASHYTALGKTIRPLVLIQFPSARPEAVEAVEKKLESMGYTYDNGMVSKWMSEDKRDLPDNLTKNDGIPVFLLMKQAISTGWDCPRAKILVKLRENMDESFTIQTIGRIRRMPERKFYDDDVLDMCYVYTFDEKFKTGLLSALDKAYEPRLLSLKEKCKSFSLVKEIRTSDNYSVSERDILYRLYDFFVKKYHLGKDKKQNRLLLSETYIFGESILGKLAEGLFVKTESTAKNKNFQSYSTNVDTNRHRLYLLHALEEICIPLGIMRDRTKYVLERLFRKGNMEDKQLLALSKNEFYAFVINNAKVLRGDFKEAASEMKLQMEIRPQSTTFRIPEHCCYKRDVAEKNEIPYSKNAYEGYTSAYATDVIRSTSERLFEQYCEVREDVDWVYKNGDSGQEYFSIVYSDAFGNQWLFYADYIVKMKDGTVWVIETKGGESKGKSKNIDAQIVNKFYAFKRYAQEKGVNWGFVRDKNERLYINNMVFAMDMADDHWQPLEEVF